jgi:hypothetical protein
MNPNVIPGDGSLLIRRDKKLYVRLPGKPDQLLPFGGAGIWPDARFLDRNTIADFESDKALAIARIDGTILFRVPVTTRWHVTDILRLAISLSVIRIAVTPVPVAILLPSVQLNESTPLVVLGLIPLVRAVFIAVPSVVVLVALVVVSLVDFALPAFLVPVTLPIFLVPVVLRAGRGHRRNRCSKGGSQKKRTEIWVSTVHVGLLWREIHIRRIPLTSLSALGAPKTGQYCSDALKGESRRLAGNELPADPFCSNTSLEYGYIAGRSEYPCPASPPHTTFAPFLPN